jgi:hypothetical protein
MAKGGVRGIFKNDPYLADRGVAVPGLAFSFKPPYDLSSTAQVNSLLTAVGATAETSADKSLCPVAAGDFTPRRVTFKRASGNSFSLVFRSLATLIANANTIKGLIDTTPDKLVCAELKGEWWKDLVGELRNAPNFAPGVGRSAKPATGGIQPYYSGKVLYEADGVIGTVPLSVRVATDEPDAAPTRIGNIWTTCVGQFEPKLPCATSSSWKYRRYIVTSKVSADPQDNGLVASYETAGIPVKDREAAQMVTCGRALANLNSTICLEYKGEKNGRFHLLLT